ncbi:MAG: hypothetical protein CME64_02350 [Halobacteriovoraceae bacterium]|nr:hypothetical protein [Halobacteriovoraceae bacterium]
MISQFVWHRLFKIALNSFTQKETLKALKGCYFIKVPSQLFDIDYGQEREIMKVLIVPLFKALKGQLVLSSKENTGKD